MTEITVKKLPIDPGPSGWDAILPQRADAIRLEDNITSDWLVIGAGFAGLAAARRLSQLCPTDKITVLDAKRVAEGPAGRNSGFMIDLPHDLSSSDYGGALDHDKLLTSDNRHAINFAADEDHPVNQAPSSSKVRILKGIARNAPATFPRWTKTLPRKRESFWTLKDRSSSFVSSKRCFCASVNTE